MANPEHYARERWQQFKSDLSRINFRQEAEELGVRLTGSGESWVQCHVPEAWAGKPDNNPSGSYNVRTGTLRDHRNGETIGFFDLMVVCGHASDWQSAQAQMAAKYNFSMPRRTKNNPQYGTTEQEWDDRQVLMFCEAKPPITPEGIRRAGGKLCGRFDVPCLSFCILDDTGFSVGRYFMPRNGQVFLDGPARGAKSVAKKAKGAEAGFVGSQAVAALCSDEKPEMVYWCEGVPDLLAAASVWPESAHLFLTNPNGCSEAVTPTQVRLLTGVKEVVLIADADRPGVAGAWKRASGLLEAGIKCRVATPFCEISDSKGKDLRDWLVGHSGIGLSGLFESLNWQEQPEDSLEDIIPNISNHVSLLMSLGLAVSVNPVSSEIRIHHIPSKASIVCKSLQCMSYREIVSVAGITYQSKVLPRPDEDSNLPSHEDVMNAISLAVHDALSVHDPRESGVWFDESGSMLVRSGDRSISVGQDGVVTLHEKSRVALMPSAEWISLPSLIETLPKASDTQWRAKAWEDLVSALGVWKWQSPQTPEVLAGFVAATWLQNAWSWRPIISILGESGAGKTLFLRALSEIFLRSSPASGGSTAAGIQQSISCQSLPVLVDEFDSMDLNNRERLQRILRNNSRGTAQLRGTPSLSAKKIVMKHLPWIAGIFSGCYSQADANRALRFPMDKSEERMDIPGNSQLQDIGLRILASTLYAYESAMQLERELSGDTLIDRVIESYIPSASCSSAILNETIEQCKARMRRYMTTVSRESQVTDQERLLEDILSYTHVLDTPRGIPTTIGDLLLKPELRDYWGFLEPLGLRVLFANTTQIASLAVAHRVVSKRGGILKGTEWEGANVLDVLSRLPFDLSKRPIRVGGVMQYSVLIPLADLNRWQDRSIGPNPFLFPEMSEA